MEISNLSDTEFNTLVIRMLKELIGYFNSIKKMQSEMKAALRGIKKKSTGNQQWSGGSQESNQ